MQRCLHRSKPVPATRVACIAPLTQSKIRPGWRGRSNYLAWQSRLILPELGQRVVEVGCGAGNFTGKLLDRDVVVALDLEPECIELLRRAVSRPNQSAQFCLRSRPALHSRISRSFQPDSCVCTNVLEHIEDDRRALAAMAEILAPKGKLVLWVPAFQLLFGPMDRQLGHFRRYRPRDITRLAGLTGLRLNKIHYVNSVGFFLWWASSHLIRQHSLTETQIDIFDRLIAPWLSRLETVDAPAFRTIVVRGAPEALTQRHQPVFAMRSRITALYSFMRAGLRFSGAGIIAASRADWSRLTAEACT